MGAKGCDGCRDIALLACRYVQVKYMLHSHKSFCETKLIILNNSGPCSSLFKLKLFIGIKRQTFCDLHIEI